MGLLDGALGGGLDLAMLAGKVGLSEEQVRGALAALAKAAGEHGDTLTLAAERTGLPVDKLAPLLAAVGGEGGVAGAAALVGGKGLGGGLGGIGKSFGLG